MPNEVDNLPNMPGLEHTVSSQKMSSKVRQNLRQVHPDKPNFVARLIFSGLSNHTQTITFTPHPMK
jgi:hypothetical protein